MTASFPTHRELSDADNTAESVNDDDGLCGALCEYPAACDCPDCAAPWDEYERECNEAIDAARARTLAAIGSELVPVEDYCCVACWGRAAHLTRDGETLCAHCYASWREARGLGVSLRREEAA